MHFDLWWQGVKMSLASWLQSLTYEDLHRAWMASGVVLLVGVVWLSYRIMRNALGHTLFRGTWYNAEQLAALVKMIDEDSARGNRVMRHDEMALLRRWRFGDDKVYSVKGSGYV